MKPRDTELAGKGEQEFEFTFEVDIHYSSEIYIAGEQQRDTYTKRMLKFIVAPDSSQAVVLLCKEINDKGEGITIHNYKVVAFEKGEA